MAILAPVLAPYGPREDFLDDGVRPRSEPCWHLLGCDEDVQQHILGTDGNGRDVLSRLIYGARISMLAGIGSVTLAVLIGAGLGLIAGYYGRWSDNVIMRFMDVLLAFPALLLAIIIVTVLGKGLFNAVIAISIVTIPIYARVVRASVLTVREQEFVAADRALGVSSRRILTHRVLPNSLTPLVVAGDAGHRHRRARDRRPQLPRPRRAAADGRVGFDAGRRAPAAAQRPASRRSPPGMLIMLNVLAFNLVGDGLRDALDPRLNR